MRFWVENMLDIWRESIASVSAFTRRSHVGFMGIGTGRGNSSRVGGARRRGQRGSIIAAGGGAPAGYLEQPGSVRRFGWKYPDVRVSVYVTWYSNENGKHDDKIHLYQDQASPARNSKLEVLHDRCVACRVSVFRQRHRDFEMI